LSWDPNQLEDSGEGSGGEAGSDGEDGDDGDDSGMEASEDEDDKTFMVRRAAAKNIASIVRNHGERLDAVVDKAAAPLVRQFKERESTARQEVLGAYETLALAVAPLGKTHAIYTAFVKSLPDAIKELAKLLQHKSADTKAAAASTLRSLGSHYTGVLGPVIPELIPGVSAGVLDSNSALRIGSLELLKQILNGSTETAPVQPHLDKLFAPVDKLLHTAGLHSRAAAAGLDACEAFLVAGAGKIDFLNRVFKTFETLYKQTDLDSEAKEAAIRAGARAICNLGTKLPNVSAALDVLIERLGSELTRETAAVAVGTIAESGTDVGSNAWLDKAVPLLLSFCAPGARTLKVAALSSLALMLENHGDTIKTHTQIVDEVAQLVDAEDMQLTQLAISVTTHAIHTSPKAVPNAKKSTYPRVQAILTSPLLEGISLTAVAEFYGELSRLDTKGFSFAELSKDLETAVKATTEVQVFRNVGACYAHVIVGTPDVKKAAATVQTLVKNVGAKTDAERLAAIYTLGEIGRAKDISEYGGVVEALAAALDAESRNVALGASLAIGRCATGNLSTYLPFILNDMKKNPKRQLLLLQAVKEIVSGNSGASAGAGLRVSLSASIAGSAVQDIAVHLDTLLPILVQHAASEDELTRNAVAECLGRLARLAPERIINEVVSRSKDASPWARATATNALRSAVSEKPSADLDSLLLKAYSVAAEAIADKDVHVRYAGLLAVTWALQVKPRIVRPHIAVALPAIYKETVVDESLIKVIDLGQIKHITDNGLDKRTAAYALLNVLLDTAFDAISVGDYLDPIVRAMEDVPNVKEDAFHLLRRLAQVAGSQLFPFLDKLVPLLEKELKRPIPKAEPGQERLLAMKRAGVQAALSLAALPNATSNAKLQELLVKHVVNGIYKDLYVEIASKSGAPAVAIAAANAAVAAAPKDAKK
jgi:cullin-associated NEDD8-dissociated protein 1